MTTTDRPQRDLRPLGQWGPADTIQNFVEAAAHRARQLSWETLENGDEEASNYWSGAEHWANLILDYVKHIGLDEDAKLKEGEQK